MGLRNLGLICAEIGLFMLIEASSCDLFLMEVTLCEPGKN